MYDSPITILESTLDDFSKAIIKQRDDEIFAEIQYSFGVALDREELIRALQYDRNQYKKGYMDGKTDAMAELVRCKDCKHCEMCYPVKQIDQEATQAWICYRYKIYRNPDDYCSQGERREGE